MRVITLSLLAGFFSISISLKAQPFNAKEKELLSFPRYEKMARNFFAHYTYESLDNIELLFARKPDGWYTYEQNPYAPDKIFNEQLFWSLKDKSFRKLNYPDAGMNGTDYPTGHMNFMTVDSFSL